MTIFIPSSPRKDEAIKKIFNINKARNPNNWSHLASIGFSDKMNNVLFKVSNQY